MSETKKVASNPEEDQLDIDIGNIAESPGDLCSVSGSVKNIKHSSTSERKIKFERAQKCLENAALVSKRIKEHRKAAAELLGKPFEDDVGDTASEMASTMSERTGYSVATDKSTTLSVQDALNIPGISESLANTLKQKELLMERIKLYKEINKRPPAKKSTLITKKDPDASTELKQNTQNVDVTKLVNTVKEKDNALSVMQVKMRAMETTILDLQEKINEKDQIIEAKNRATTLMSDSLSKKDKDSMDLLEDTKQQMTKMQQYFVAMESEWKDDKARLLKQIEEKNEKIVSLEEANTILENSRFEISVAHSKLAEELDSKNKEILELQERIEELSITEHAEKEKEHNEEEKGSIEIAEMVDLTKKVELLEQLNYQIRQTNKELESQLALMTSESKVSTVAAGVSTKKGSPVTHRKGGRGMKSKSPWSNLSPESMQDTEKKTPKHDNSKSEMILQSLNKEILDKEYLISQKEELISQLKSANDQKDATISDLKLCLETQKESSIEKVDICISTDIQSLDLSDSDIQLQVVPSRNLDAPLDDPESIPMGIKELEQKFKDAQVQIKTLTEEIDAANKNMIKVKSSSKLKVKQMQKTIDNFSKVSDSNAEIVKLNEELHQLSQKVAELEEEKGNLQLHLVDYDSGRLTESDVYKKLVEMENLAETRLKSISLLETQKFDLVQELHVLQQQNIDLEDKLADMSQLQNDQVCSEIKSVQLEEQIDELLASKKELELIIQNLKLDKEQSIGTIQILQEEKNDLIQKLDNYIQENIELTDKLEKLSAEKVSSAESIEIVESLTTQEKLELEEYNKGLSTEKTGDEHLNDNYTSDSRKCDENIENLVKQSAELNEKVELFTNERQEVMDKMNMISVENESLHMQINELNTQCNSLRTNIELLTEEKHDLKTLNDELNQEIEELKRERVEIIKETVEIVKPLNLDENLENLLVESNEEKSGGDKGNNRSTKSVKQLTKEILKLKNTIKEREAEIADSQMKILSLEEQQQKQNEIKQNSVAYDDKIKHLVEENNLLKKEIVGLKDSVSEQDQVHSQEGQFQEEMNKLHQEYSAAINTRESRIQELENLLKEYEKQTLNYINSLQQKDKEITEYINQITKLNDVSQKLKSTIDLLEEEKAKDQNAEVVKSLNKQISIYQKTLSDYEEKLKSLEDEKAQLSSLKAMLEKKSNNLESELKNLHDRIAEKETLIKELTMQQQKNAEEFSSIKIQAKEQDEEIHEIKLQLRKESIENEKLRTTLQQKDNEFIELRKSYDERKDNVETASNDYKNLKEQYTATESKNKELMEKLKKYAINFKKKSAMFTDLESQFNDLQKDLENKNQQVEQLMIQVESIPALQEKLKVAEEEFYRLQSERTTLEQNAQEIETLRDQHAEQSQVVIQLNEALNQYSRDLNFIKEENANLQAQNDYYSKKIVEYEIEQKNNTNLLTKILCLEADIAQKQMHVEELSNELKNHEEKFTQTQFAHDAKVQECELYIESLQTEIEKYKARISRLEDSISVMEERRHSLERKADQLDGQLQEKQTAYSEYSYQEDELVSRLATLMDHDRVIEKQLFEIESENQELHYKIQYLRVEYQQLQNTYSDLQDYCKILELKVSKIDSVETDVTIYQSKITDLESTIRRLTNENMTLSAQKKSEIEELELEFNTQIENAIKDKKILSEKYEMLREKENLLESKLQEYVTNLENLKINMNDLTKENQNLMERSMLKEKDPVPDYTEQYIAEINNLNSVINSRNEEISSLKSKIENLQAYGLESKNNFEANMSDVTEKLQQVSSEVDSHVLEVNSLKDINKELMFKLSQKEEQIKQLVKEKRLVFEMNIPKTEGLMISSTIEALSDDKVPDMSDLMSQIVSNPGVSEPDPEPLVKKKTKNTDSQQVSATSVEGVVEPPMISKKSFLCYDNDEPTKEEDPFNSEEGWGMDLHDETMDVTPGLSDLNRKIEILNQENQKLRADLDNNNTKLLKALKKLKELKASNDMLTNELKISKQISQSSMLDMAIESEMSNNVQELERKIEELNANIAKEKREKESLKKQNDVFKDANDRLTEIKEKMDNEIEVWKYNFKQANDKVSTLQWGTESKYNPTEHSNKSSLHSVKGNESKEELIKLETENEELQALVDKLSIENKELSTKLEQMKEELNNLGIRLSEPIKCANCESMQIQLEEFQKLNEVKEEKIVELQEKISNLQIEYDESIRNCKEENSKLLEQSKTSFLDNISSLQKEIERFKISESEAANTITTLTMDLHDTKLWLEKSKNFDMERIENASIISETCKTLEERCNSLENQLENANFAVLNVTTENNELIEKLNTCDFEIKELNEKLQYANTEKSVIIQSELDHANQSISSLESLNNELLQKIQLNEEKIKELQDKLQYANTEQNILIQSELEHAKQSISNLESLNNELLQKIQPNEDKIKELEDKLQNLNSENDQLLSTVAELRSSTSSAIDQRGFEIAELWKQHLAQRESEFQKIEQELRTQVNASENKYEQLLDRMQSSSQEETEKIIMVEQVTSLQNKIHEKEEHLTSLQAKYADVIHQLDLMRSEMEDEKLLYENKMLGQQEENDKIMQELTVRNEKLTSDFEIALKAHENELSTIKATNDNLNKQIGELRNAYEMKIMELTRVIQIKDSEIYQKAHEFGNMLKQRNSDFEYVRTQLIEYERKLEEIGFEKESELALLRLKMHDTIDDFEDNIKKLEAEKSSLEEALNSKIIECTNQNKEIADLNKSLEEYSNKITEMEVALENQEIEIVTLKDEVSSLNDIIRASSSKIEKHVTFASDTKHGAEGEQSETLLNRDLLDAVPRAELDLALYMLHQRDVRCEELTMELTQLLEERDTLQLRLSDSIRSLEELKLKSHSGLDVSSTSGQDTISDLPSTSLDKDQQFVDTHRSNTSRSSSISDPDGDRPKLQAKLTELRSVKQSRDVRLRHDSEQRQLGMRLLQRDVANLPPEAVDQLNQAHHTLTRDAQSTPTVLLNWLRGKSTPKVVHM